MLTLLSGILSFVVAITLQFNTSQETHAFREINNISLLSHKVNELELRINALSKNPIGANNNENVSQAIAHLQSDLKALTDKLALFEIALGDDPAKKLAVPLLRRDIDNLKEGYRADLVALREESKSNMDLIKWVFGLLGLTNISAFLSSLYAGKRGKQEEAQ